MIIPSDRTDEELRILDYVRRGDRFEHYETVRRRKDGRLVDISLTVSPVKNPEGLVVGASKIARDITRRKRDAECVETLNLIARTLSSDLDLERIVQTVTDNATGWPARSSAHFSTMWRIAEGGRICCTRYQARRAKRLRNSDYRGPHRCSSRPSRARA